MRWRFKRASAREHNSIRGLPKAFDDFHTYFVIIAYWADHNQSLELNKPTTRVQPGRPVPATGTSLLYAATSLLETLCRIQSEMSAVLQRRSSGVATWL